MKTTFPENSQAHKSRIREISEVIVNTAQDKIAFIILFGSFARGTQVHDKYVEDGILYEYASDYDFIIITKTGKQAGSTASFDLERKIEKAVKAAGLIYHAHNPHYIIESIDRVNEELEKSQYFFSDIKKEGVLLYSSGEFELSEPKEIDKESRREIAREDYKYWFDSSEGFLRDSHNTFQINDYRKSSFYLHQATESLYNCTLLTLTGYKPKSHDLKDLNHLCAIQSNDFLKIFPLATEEQKQSFKLLQKAYIDARYNKNFKITKDQLEYLISRVEGLKSLVKSVCKERV
jgi:uncharacterized protein